MEIQFLGTSAATPARNRNLTALALRPDQHKDWYLFDCGEATQHQIMKSQFSLAKLSKIFISHLHGDHWYGLPGLLNTRSLYGMSEPLQIYGPQGIEEALRTILRFSGANPSFPIDFIEITESGLVYENDSETISARALSHDLPCYAYIFEECERLGEIDAEALKRDGLQPGPLYGDLKAGKTVESDGKTYNPSDYMGATQKGAKVIVSGDNDSPDLLADDVTDLTLLIHEATHTEESMAKLDYQSRHSTAAKVSSFAEEANIPALILTHISPRFETDAEIIAEAKKHYSGNLHVAADFMRLTISKNVLTIHQSEL
ncbi:MAG: ribonuclease Z [Lentisphaeria bacterium]|nr:ribonuclease Z [Lentisphaeria bacterium]